MRRTLVWRGTALPLMEIAEAEVTRDGLSARGTQIGVAYELRYELVPGRLRAEVQGGPRIDIGLDGADYFDLGYSPLFNSLPLLDGLEAATDFVMAFVAVPSLEVSRSDQRYEPLGDGAVRYSSGSFVAQIEFDSDGFVTRYESLAERVG
ncbi:MAG TPA: putative glycolipid-binding domain-containing protein [Gaiellaceae bacterium]|nr:putative glycolipid-binding domain-containing protein [Gaiellaceae bacterium]